MKDDCYQLDPFIFMTATGKMAENGVRAEPSIGKLTPAEDLKLREAWTLLLHLCKSEAVAGKAIPPESARFLQHISHTEKDIIAFRQGLWRFVLGDHPDALVLRFLRARNWDVERAVEMLVSAVNWRREVEMDQGIIRDGENVFSLQTDEQQQNPVTDLDREFIAQYRSGKSYARGTDRQGRLVYIGRVQLHNPHAQSAEAMERYILHSVESLKLVARAPQDQVCLVFDLTGFSLRNMDFHVVKFITEIFEARYPETLGVVLVHNAPFVFWGIWRVIKPWLDPIIASKVNFTNGKSGLGEYIADDTLQKDYGGTDPWQYKYIEPVTGENDRLNIDEKRFEVQAQRDDLISQFEQLTSKWAADSGQLGEQQRELVVQSLQSNYWQLDPYIRARTYYHRAGVIDSEGHRNLRAAP